MPTQLSCLSTIYFSYLNAILEHRRGEPSIIIKKYAEERKKKYLELSSKFTNLFQNSNQNLSLTLKSIN